MYTFILLGCIGGKMIKDSFSKKDGEEKHDKNSFGFIKMLILALAASIDALAVGTTFAFFKGPLQAGSEGAAYLPGLFPLGVHGPDKGYLVPAAVKVMIWPGDTVVFVSFQIIGQETQGHNLGKVAARFKEQIFFTLR
jgi:hypothetical protein